jgi:hypothetical protein
MSTRVYRTLLWLYPRSFRVAYGDDMVAVFEEMQRDRSPLALWWRVVVDAVVSVTVQRLESVMSKRSNLFPLGFAAVAALVLVVASARGIENVAVFLATVTISSAAIIAALIYWQSNRAYVEPSEELHRYWWRPLVGGAALIGIANAGTALDIEAPWLVLFTTIILGVLLIAVGVILTVWHVVARMRPATV